MCPGCSRVFWREDAASRSRREQNLNDPATEWVLGLISGAAERTLHLVARSMVAFARWRTAHFGKMASSANRATSYHPEQHNIAQDAAEQKIVSDISPRDGRHSA